MQSINFDEIGGENPIDKVTLERLAKSFYSSKRIVALTGAGISVSAGIPDFRSAGGLYERVRLKYAPQKATVKGKDFFDINFFLQPDSRPLFYQFIAELKESCSQAKPTPTHHFLKKLAEDGKLARWYTQNIDCLEERLGLDCWSTATTTTSTTSTESVVVSLHGTLSQVTCTLCKVTTSFKEEYLDHFKTGKELPCKACSDAAELRESMGRRKLRSGFLRPDIVLYNEPHPHGETIADFVSADLSKQPNLLLVMGTSLKIAGLKKMIKDFAKSMKSRPGGENNLIVYVNKTPCSRAEWQGVFDYELIGECDKWISFLGNEFQRVKRFPKGANKPVVKSTTDKPTSIKTPTVPVVIPTQQLLSSPVQPKQKKKKPIIANSVGPKIAEALEIVASPSSPSRSAPRRIDEFFTPVKGVPVRLSVKDKKDSVSGSNENQKSTRILRKGSGLAM